MDNSFFDFDTSEPLGADSSSKQHEELSEEEYDAFNDETFGSATNYDWEEAHESLLKLNVSLSGKEAASENTAFDFGDVNNRSNLSRTHNESQVNKTNKTGELGRQSPQSDSREHFVNSPGKLQTQSNLYSFLNGNAHAHVRDSQLENFDSLKNCSFDSNRPKLCTLDDIERNIIFEQAKQAQEKEMASKPLHAQQATANMLRNQQKMQRDLLTKGAPPPGFRPDSNQFPNNLFQPQKNKRALSSNVGLPQMNNFYPLPANIANLTQPGYNQIPPHPLLNMHHGPQRPPNAGLLPIPMNNFPIHPNLNVVRAINPHLGIYSNHLDAIQPIGPRIVPGNQSFINPQQAASNMFNMRLVQEIKNNHPLLQNVNQMRQAHQLQQSNKMFARPSNEKQKQQPGDGRYLPLEFDDYANLMSTRDKHWLIGIQLSQLNTDTPYIDDFYYFVQRQRKFVAVGHSQAHKDNQLNHPFTQPKGHAQLAIAQLGNKNGFYNNQNHLGQEQKINHPNIPFKFENSLGKLQYGSVTAPRKIIDAEIMNSDSECTKNSTSNENITSINIPLQSFVRSSPAPTTSGHGLIGDVTHLAHSKPRYILLYIETLFRYVLKLEDLDNPIAISTIINKTRKESERIAALEHLEKAQEDRLPDASNSQQPVGPQLKNKFAYEIETRENLIAKLEADLTCDKVAAIMNVHKGKALINRILPFIENHKCRWDVWTGVFLSTHYTARRKQEDSEKQLSELHLSFKRHIQMADFETVIRICSALNFEKKSNIDGNFNKFLISSLVFVILRVENIYLYQVDSTLTKLNKEKWYSILKRISNYFNPLMKNHLINVTLDSDMIALIKHHFSRFEDLQPQSFLKCISTDIKN